MVSGVVAAAMSATCLPISGSALAGDLSIDVQGVRSTAGRVYVAVHVSSDAVSFPDPAGVVAGGWRNARLGSPTVVFPGLPGNRYAVAVFHDENGNGEMDSNVLGLPLEGYGFANDASGAMGPPSFEAASIEVGTGATVTAVVTLNY